MSKLLRDAGEALYGPRWQSDLARDLHMSDRHVRRLASGAAPVTDGISADLQRLCEERIRRLEDVLSALRQCA